MIKVIGKTIVSICTHISPKLGCKVIYFIKFRKKLNLKNPKHFNEKLMWLKLNNYNNNEIVWKCADKYMVREYYHQKGISDDNLTNIIGVYNDAKEIDFSKLPKKFALKCTHGMGFNIICEDKDKLNIKKSVRQLNKWLNTKFGYSSAETHYNKVKPRIICEQFIENKKNEFPIDYKFYCFNGVPKIVLVCTNRKEHYKTSFYDLNWKKLHLRHDENEEEILQPKAFKEMISISKKVSSDFPFVRVDFFELNGKAILGELTFTPAACLGKYKEAASLELGNMLNLDNAIKSANKK